MRAKAYAGAGLLAPCKFALIFAYVGLAAAAALDNGSDVGLGGAAAPIKLAQQDQLMKLMSGIDSIVDTLGTIESSMVHMRQWPAVLLSLSCQSMSCLLGPDCFRRAQRNRECLNSTRRL